MVVAGALVQGSLWQGQVHRLVGAPPPRSDFAVGMLVAALVAAGLVATWRVLRWAGRRVARVLGLFIPPRVARVTGPALVSASASASAMVFVNDVVVVNLLEVADEAFAAVNGVIRPGTVPPSTAVRSGSDESWTP